MCRYPIPYHFIKFLKYFTRSKLVSLLNLLKILFGKVVSLYYGSTRPTLIIYKVDFSTLDSCMSLDEMTLSSIITSF